MFEDDINGAIDYVVVELPRTHITGELVPELLDLVDRRLIRVIDVMVVLKTSDQEFGIVRVEDLDPQDIGDSGALAGASSGLLGDEDAAAIAELLEAGHGALALVYENLWSLPFASAIRRAGGRLVSRGHLPIPAIEAELDRLGV